MLFYFATELHKIINLLTHLETFPQSAVQIPGCNHWHLRLAGTSTVQYSQYHTVAMTRQVHLQWQPYKRQKILFNLSNKNFAVDVSVGRAKIPKTDMKL